MSTSLLGSRRLSTMAATLALIGATAAALPAAILFDPMDLRLGYAQGGSAVTSRTNGVENLSKWDAVHRMNAEFVLGVSLPVPLTPGILGGAGVTYDRRSGEDLKADTGLWRLELGPYLKIGPVAVEVVGQYGQGRTTLTNRLTDDKDGGPASELAVEARVVASFLGFVAGVAVGAVDQKLTASPGGSELEITSRDYTAGVFLGTRF